MEGGMVMTNTNAADGGARSVHTLAIDKRRHAAITGVTDVWQLSRNRGRAEN